MRPPHQFENTLHWLREELPRLPDARGQLPTERDLARRRRASVATLRKALGVLEKEGLVTRRQGKGTFVRFPSRLDFGGPEGRKQHAQEGSARDCTLGVLAFDDNGRAIPRGIYWDVYLGMQEEAAAAGHSLSLSIDEGEAPFRERFFSLVAAGRMDGCVLLGITDPEIHARLAASKTPCILVDHWPADGAPMDSIETDSEADTREAVRVLAHLGHRRIAFVDRLQPEMNPARRTGYEQGLASLDLRFPAEYLQRSGEKPALVAKVLHKLMALDPPPTAVLVHSAIVAEHLRAEAAARGFTIPRDFSLVSFGGLAPEEIAERALSRMATDFKAMGRMAVRRLVARISGERSAPRKLFIPGQFFLGATVAPPSR